MDDLPASHPHDIAELRRALAEFRPDWIPFLPDLVRLFDVDWYLAQLERAPLHEPPLIHFLRTVQETRASPHPLFDTRHYLTIYPDLANPRVNPLVHFVKAGYLEGRQFHPLFVIEHYRRLAGASVTADTNLALHYLEVGAHKGWHPWPGYDPTALPGMDEVPEAERSDPFLAYLKYQHGRDRDPMPRAGQLARVLLEFPTLIRVFDRLLSVFDFEHYQRQLDALGIVTDNPILHYFRDGAALGLDPNPLFDTRWYHQHNPQLRERRVNALDDFLHHATPAAAKFHPLFDVAWFEKAHAPVAARRPALAAEPNPLVRYCRTPVAERVSPTPLFDLAFYRSVYDDIDWTAVDPLLHYLSAGHREGRWPHGAFDPEFHARTTGHDPHSGRSPLTAFAAIEPAQRKPAFAMFDVDYYRSRVPEVMEAGAIPFGHFVRHGLHDGKPCNPLLSAFYTYDKDAARSCNGRSPTALYLEDRARLAFAGEKPRRILFVGHDGNRTGAPLILLRIVQYFARLGYECITILDKGGELQESFERCSHVYLKKVDRTAVVDATMALSEFAAELSPLLALFQDHPPLLAVCNSAEIWPYTLVLKELGLPVVTLVHELADFYGGAHLDALVASSDAIVCPAAFVAERMRQWAPHSAAKLSVLPQGLLRDNYGAVQWGMRETLLRGHGIDPDDVVILGCGTADGRKGFDIFVDVASQVLAQLGEDPKVTFLWLGADFDVAFRQGRWLPAGWDTTRYWAIYDHRVSGIADRIRFVPPVEDTESYVSSADIFLLTSRADPFPCVVHEAMACGKTVVAFAGAGGAPEAIAETGVVVPYNDRPAMAARLLALIRDPAQRRKLGDAAKHRVRTVYRYDDYCAGLARLFGQVVGTTLAAPPSRVAPAAAMRIYLAAADWMQDAASQRIDIVGRHLQEKGYAVEVLFTGGRYVEPARLAGMPEIPYRFLQPRTMGPENARVLLERFLRDNAPCVLFTNADPVAGAAAAALPSAVGVVGSVQGDSLQSADLDVIFRSPGAWNRIVASEAPAKARIAAFNPRLDAHTVWIPYGTQAPGAQAVREAVRTRSAALGPLRLCLAGRFSGDRSRLVPAVDFIRAMTHRRVPFTVTILGESGNARLNATLATVRIAGIVEIAEPLTAEQLRDRLMASHLLVSFADPGALPPVVVDAMGCGCVPVVMTGEEPTPPLLRDGENALVIPPGAWQGLAMKLEALQKAPQAWAKLARAAAKTPARYGMDRRTMLAAYVGLVDEVFADLASRRTVRLPPPG